MEGKAIIGSYANPSGDDSEIKSADVSIIDKREKVSSPTTNMHEGIQEDLRQGIKGTQDSVEKAHSYEDILADNDIDKSQAQDIVDAMLSNGYYEDSVPVTKKTTVTLRTRSYEDYKRYLRGLELINPRFVEEQQEIMGRYFLASSIVGFKGEQFVHVAPTATPKEIEDAFDVRMEWVAKQPERIVNLLISKLSAFDRTVQIVMSEGVVENF